MKKHLLRLSLACLLALLSACDSKTPSKWVAAEGGLRMRASADANATVVLLIPQGSEVKMIEEVGPSIEISGRTGKWTKVKFENSEGWVFGGFLSATPTDGRPLNSLSAASLPGKSIVYKVPVFGPSEVYYFCGSGQVMARFPGQGHQHVRNYRTYGTYSTQGDLVTVAITLDAFEECLDECRGNQWVAKTGPYNPGDKKISLSEILKAGQDRIAIEAHSESCSP